MGILRKNTNKNIRYLGIKDDLLLTDSKIIIDYSIFGIKVYEHTIIEDVRNHADYVDYQATESPSVGFKKNNSK